MMTRGVPTRPPGQKMVRIWADGDACPPACLETLFAAAQRHQMVLTLISTRERVWPQSAFIRTSMLNSGGITRRLQLMAMQGDLVVSADAPLLGDLQRRGIAALKPDSSADLGARLDTVLVEQRTRLEGEALAAADLVRQRKLTPKTKPRPAVIGQAAVTALPADSGAIE